MILKTQEITLASKFHDNLFGDVVIDMKGPGFLTAKEIPFK